MKPVAGSVDPPVKKKGRPAKQPSAARRNRAHGEVVLRAVVDRTGAVTGIEVLQGLPYGLSEAAVKAVEGWRYEPATFEGRAVPVYHLETVEFRIGKVDPN